MVLSIATSYCQDSGVGVEALCGEPELKKMNLVWENGSGGCGVAFPPASVTFTHVTEKFCLPAMQVIGSDETETCPGVQVVSETAEIFLV